MQRDPTRDQRVLELFCTNKPSLVKSMSTVPGISDRDAIVADSDIKPAYVKKAPRNVFLSQRQTGQTVWSNMRDDSSKFATEFLGRYATISVICLLVTCFHCFCYL